MNAREGMRRLGVLVGVLGAILGGFASYVDLRQTIEARARFKAFESLVTSEVVQQERKSWFLANVPPGYDPSSSEVNRNGIKTIHWTKSLGIASIDMQDGTTVYEATPPVFWAYLLAALFPVLGFFIPWGVVHAVTWVGLGFLRNSS